jgi:hypothetical protein
VVLAWSNDPDSYTGGSSGTGTAFPVRQVKSDNPTNNGHPGPPVWRGWAWV